MRDRPDHRLSPGDEEGHPAGQEDRQRPHLRGRDLARERAAAADRQVLAIFGGRSQPVMAHLIEPAS